jgi:hypothetical protein
VFDRRLDQAVGGRFPQLAGHRCVGNEVAGAGEGGDRIAIALAVVGQIALGEEFLGFLDIDAALVSLALRGGDGSARIFGGKRHQQACESHHGCASAGRGQAMD